MMKRTEKKYSEKAVLSFVLVLICILWVLLLIIIPSTENYILENILDYFYGFVLYMPFVCLVSIVLAITGIIEIKKNKNLKGMWLAISALVLSILSGFILTSFVFIGYTLSQI